MTYQLLCLRLTHKIYLTNYFIEYMNAYVCACLFVVEIKTSNVI